MVIAAQRVSLLVVSFVVLLAALTLWAVPAEFIPYWLGGIGAVTLFVTYTFLGSPLKAVLFWLVCVTCLDEEFYRLIVPGFFNLTISRVLLAGLVLLFLAMWAVDRIRLRSVGWAGVLMVMILACFTTSAAVSGFQTASLITVHYRLIGGYWFPFVVFFMMVHAIQTDRDIKRLLTFFLFLGIYLTFTGWAEHLKVWALVWPKYISDPDLGIHWGRVRGPFLAAPIMGLALVFVFFSNILLARMSGPAVRIASWLTSLAMLPVIFWTHTRSVWLAMAAGAIVWIGWTRRGLSRIISISLIMALVIVAGALNWQQITSPQREVGGVTSIEPIYVRFGLALITLDMFSDHPLFGVGFGHFRDHAPLYAHNPASPYYRFAAQAIEHNNFLSVLAECGLTGLILYVLLLIVLFRASLRVYRRLPTTGNEPVSRQIIILYWILLLDFLIDGMFRETSVSPFANVLFFAVSGVVFALDYCLSPTPLPEPELARTSGVPATQ